MQMHTDIEPALKERISALIEGESTYPVSPGLIERFINCGTLHKYSKGELITRAGEVYTDVGIVVEGITRIWRPDGNTQKTDYFGMPGTLCMSIHGFIYNLPAVANREACCDSTLLIVNRDDYNKLVDDNHGFALWSLGNAYFQLYGFEMKQQSNTGAASDRYDFLRRNRPDILHRVPLKVIASYLGITPQYLSRLRRKYRDML